MAVVIAVTPIFVRNARDLNLYLERNFGISVARKFQQKLDRRILLLKEFPFSGTKTLLPNVMMIVVTKHNKLYYRIE